MATKLENLSVEEISLVDAPANPGARVILMKRDDGPPTDRTKGRGIMDPNTDERATLLKRLAEYLGVNKGAQSNEPEGDNDMADAAVEKQITDLTATVESITKAKAETETKLADAEAKLAKAAEDAAAVEKKNTELADRIAKLEGARELAELTETLKDLEGVVKVDEFAPVYAALKKTDAAAAESLVKSLRAAKAQSEAAFKIVGKDGTAPAGADAAIEKAVTAHMAANPKVTKAQATDEVLKADPALYVAYLAEKE